METTKLFRLSTLVILGCMSCNQGFSQTIDVEEARSRAIDILSQNRPKFANGRHNTNSDIETVKLSYTAQSGDSVFYYVFDYADGGFSIIGGDEAARTVLGYCPDGKFDQESMPDGLRFMLQCFESQIRAGMQAKNSIEETNSARRASVREKSDIAPMLTSKWGQDYPYNNKIPKYEGMKESFPVGCGATAAAQVMNYYKHPAKGFGYNAYQLGYGNVSVTFEANFGQTTYDWSNMPDDIKSQYASQSQDYPIAEIDALSTLSYHVGVALNMDYQEVGSSSTYTAAVDVLPKFFSYNKGARLVNRENIQDDEWEQMVFDELSRGHPVLYYGIDSRAGGHAFVCDGYQAETNLFHINWGWEGFSDGYYALTGDNALDPSNYNFKTGQSIVLDLYPAAEEVAEWIPVEKIEIVDHINENGRLEAIVSPSNATLKDVCWISTNPTAFAVDQNGKVMMDNSGLAQIIATACDGSGVSQLYHVSAGNILLVGTADEKSNAMPMGNYYKYSTVVMEFTRNEISDMPIIINSLSFNVATSSALETDIEIYIIDERTPEDELTKDDLVYSGHRNIGKYTGWETIKLDRPFINWGTDIKVIITHRSDTYNGTLLYYCTNMSDIDAYYSYAKYRQSDTDPQYADATNTFGYTFSPLRPQVVFGIQSELQTQCGYYAQLGVEPYNQQVWFTGNGYLWTNWEGKSQLFHQLTGKMEVIIIEPGITAIPSDTFKGLKNVHGLILGDRYATKHTHDADNTYVDIIYPGVERIGIDAFAQMTDLEYIESGLIPPPIDNQPFARETLKNATLFVPEGCVEAYRNAPIWCKFENIQALDDNSKTYVGDMNKDKRLDVADLTRMVLQVKTDTKTTQSNAYMDVNRDGWINKKDVSALASILLRIRLK